MASSIGQKELKTNWPVVSGLDSDSKHQGRTLNLIPQGHLNQKSTVLKRDTYGIQENK